MSLLELTNVSVRYVRDGQFFQAVDDVSINVEEGETLALVGESGSGKTTLARAVVGLTPLSSGTVTYAGEPLPRRGRRPVAVVFQDPVGSLDPRMTIGRAIEEVLTIHQLARGHDRPKRVSELLSQVGLPANAITLRPNQLSGGQQQRASIARALAAEPRVLFLDEPVSALDVSVRAQILRLLSDLRARLRIAYVFIAHDLTVVSQLADRIAVMYRGRLVEVAPAPAFFADQLHPYSRSLIEAVPSIRNPSPPPPPPSRTSATSDEGCVYAHRCPWADGPSFSSQPTLENAQGTRLVACHHWRKIAADTSKHTQPAPH
jgi:oligopeptide/dipeptide ABC transporter ATP-binding protein